MRDIKIIVVTGAGSGIGRATARTLSAAGHCVYAGIRLGSEHGKAHEEDALRFAREHAVALKVLELDVLSEPSCRAAVDQVLAEQGRIDVVVNNAGMLMVGMTEAFAPDQVAQIFDTNATSWLRVNRAALPVMRRQGRGTLVYISSTTAHIFEPFMGPYVASKAAGEALAEVMGLENSAFGIDTVIVIPGAITSGTDHFAHAHRPTSSAIVAQYGDLPKLAETQGAALDAIDASHGGAISVEAIGGAVRDVLDVPPGERPRRVVIDGQRKGVEDLVALHAIKQEALFRQLGVDHLLTVPSSRP